MTTLRISLSSFVSLISKKKVGRSSVQLQSKTTRILSSSSSLSYDNEHNDILTYCVTNTMVDDNHHDFIRNMERLLFMNGMTTMMQEQREQNQKQHQYQYQPNDNHHLQKQDEQQKEQQVVEQHLVIDDMPLPMTFDDAISASKKRAIIITECQPPYKIVYVNDGWSQLCGYTYYEAINHTIGSLLYGPQTNTLASTTLISKLMSSPDYNDNNHSHYEIGTTLINYKKDGTQFVNRIRVGPLYNDDNNGHNMNNSISNYYYDQKQLRSSTRSPTQRMITHYVGVLQEIPMK